METNFSCANFNPNDCIYRDRDRQDQHVLIHLTTDDDTGEPSYWVVQGVVFRSLVELIDMYQCTPLTTKEGDEITLTVPLMPVRDIQRTLGGACKLMGIGDRIMG
jgi:hypothetical protein